MKLKRIRTSADTSCMILPSRGPLSPFGWPLRALYVALNSPVVTLESFPNGPAAAAVALHEEGASLCVRSVKSGQVQWFVTADDLRSDTRVAMDAALSFAESMGFLFDEDEVARRGDAGPAEAVALWLEVCGEDPDALADTEDFELDFGGPESLDPSLEILLTDPHRSGLRSEAEVTRPDLDPDPAPVERIEAPRADLAPAAVLTKFRRVPDPSSETAAPSGQPVDLRLRLMSRF
jgi:hypothetical protein